MKIMKLALTALFAVLAFSVLAASSALAAHPEFLTETGREEAFTGQNAARTIPTLRALNAGVLGTITCETLTVTGHVLDKSPLAHRVITEFSKDCLQTISGRKSTCVEPIRVKEALGELGLILGNKTVGILLAPSDGTRIFAEPSCGGMTTRVLGAIVGEIPERFGVVNQYDKQLKESLQVFETVGKNSEEQNPISIELLGVNMTKADLDVEGFFGGLASEEADVILKSTSGIAVCVLANCPMT
jgi:hypothetical protein